MTLHRRLLTHAVVISVASTALSAGAPPPPRASSAVPALAASFQAPPDDARIMMRWWWFGPTVSKDGLARELRAMKDGGIGGVEIQPVYPVTLDDAPKGLVTSPYLSDAFLDHVRFAARTARDLGMRVDLTLGSGWPYGGPSISMDDAAGKLRVERVAVPAGRRLVPVPDIRVGERLLAAFVAPASAPVTAASVREVTDIRDGILHLADASAQAREALFFIDSHSGMMVKRAAVGAEGYVLDHYDRDALDRYLGRVGARLLSAFDAVPPTAIFCDSLEVYDSDWTDRFLDAFTAKRGYDLRPHLPVLALGTGREADALRHDWGRTLTELVDEQFIAPMQAWATARGTKFRLQGYGVPPATITSNAGVDLPEGEGAQWKTLRASRWAASIGHLYGRPVISSETWTWLHSPVFMASPLDMKAEADLHFLQGINQLIGHGWPYTADGVAYPGWRFYAAGVFNDRNPWWNVMPDVSRYMQRVSHLLRQGQPVADVAVYLPVADTWAHFVPGKIASMIETMSQRMGEEVVASILDAGFNLDFVDDGVLTGRAAAQDGVLTIGTNRYGAIVVPGIERMEPATIRRLESFAKAGVRVIATRRRPELAPGFKATAADHGDVAAAAARLFDSTTFVTRDRDLGAALASMFQPDVAVSAGAGVIGAVHRSTPEADLYFVANTSNTPQSFRATFRVSTAQAEQWNPVTGALARIAAAASGTGTALDLALAPYESTVIVFPRNAALARKDRPARGRAAIAPIDLSRDWSVRIAGRPPEAWPALKSWTDDEATRYFSGVALYEKTVDIPAAMVKPGLAVSLEFAAPTPLPVGGPKARFQAWLEPPVREAAEVYVNGERAGSLWCPPYRLDLTGQLRPGANTIRIEVANLAINHMAGRALPDYRFLNLRYGSRFDPQDMDTIRPIPSGLFGPIRLVAAPAPGSSIPR